MDLLSIYCYMSLPHFPNLVPRCSSVSTCIRPVDFVVVVILRMRASTNISSTAIQSISVFVIYFDVSSGYA